MRSAIDKRSEIERIARAACAVYASRYHVVYYANVPSLPFASLIFAGFLRANSSDSSESGGRRRAYREENKSGGLTEEPS